MHRILRLTVWAEDRHPRHLESIVTYVDDGTQGRKWEVVVGFIDGSTQVIAFKGGVGFAQKQTHSIGSNRMVASVALHAYSRGPGDSESGVVHSEIHLIPRVGRVVGRGKEERWKLKSVVGEQETSEGYEVDKDLLEINSAWRKPVSLGIPNEDDLNSRDPAAPLLLLRPGDACTPGLLRWKRVGRRLPLRPAHIPYSREYNQLGYDLFRSYKGLHVDEWRFEVWYGATPGTSAPDNYVLTLTFVKVWESTETP